jgi:hypothetical protein
MANIHNLSGNAKEDSPHEIIVVDTETRHTVSGDSEVHRIRLWCALVTRRHGKNPSRPRQVPGHGRSPAQLAEFIDSQVKTQPAVWVYCHNLSFDLAVTQLPLALMDLGWTMTQHNLASDAPWAMLRNGNRSMRLVDSHSVLPAPLAQIGERIGVPKPPLPAQDDDESVWFARCWSDVEITTEALVQCLDWWDEHKLGHWSITGPQCAWNSYRHRCVRRKDGPPVLPRGPRDGGYTVRGDGHVVINPDPVARVFERATLYQGRRDAWRAGRLPDGQYAEVDMQRAHLTVAAELPLPCKRGIAFEYLDNDSPYLDRPMVGIIAEVTVRTTSARYPLRLGGRILHPAGTFTTTLAGPEIREARARGELVCIGAGYFYSMSYHMQPWALWLEQLLAAEGEPVPPAVMIMLKGWSRSCFGKWAGRTSHQVLSGSSNVIGWTAEHGVYAATGAPCTILHMRGTMSLTVKDIECDDSFPAVLSYVQSYVRVALNRAIDRIGEHRVVTCSTDSVLVDCGPARPADGPVWAGIERGADGRAVGEQLCLALTAGDFPFRWALKAVGRVVDVLSPQHVTMDGDRKYSGVPKGAEKTRPKEYTFYTWPKLGRQMEIGGTAKYVRERRTVTFKVPLIPRYVAADGCTAAPRVELGKDGMHHHLPPYRGGCAHHGQPWADEQYPGLIGGRTPRAVARRR